MQFYKFFQRMSEIIGCPILFNKRTTLLFNEFRTFSNLRYEIPLVCTKKQNYDIHPHADYYRLESFIWEGRLHNTSTTNLQFKGLHLR